METIAHGTDSFDVAQVTTADGSRQDVNGVRP